MAVYIVKEEKKMKIITVRVDQEVYFQADYAGRILVRADSTWQALMKFHELPDEVKFPDQHESPSEGDSFLRSPDDSPRPGGIKRRSGCLALFPPLLCVYTYGRRRQRRCCSWTLFRC